MNKISTIPRKGVSRVEQRVAGDLLKKIFSKIKVPNTYPSSGTQSSQSPYSSHWKGYLKSKGSYYPLIEMQNMRRSTSSVTRGFGLDRRFSPSFDYYIEQSVYRDILSIPESNFGGPEMLFYGLNGERRSGVFLRNACYAYEIVTKFNRARDDSFTILEIGSGFGMLAYILKNYYKNAKLFLIDLPETLAICAWYLENTLPDCSFLYWPADSDASLAAAEVVFVNAKAFLEGMGDYDLVINCDSMSEMTADVACNYLKIIEADIRDEGMFFFLNKEGIDKEAMTRPTQYPFSTQWVVESIRPTYVGFLDDYRHIQMCLRWSTRQVDLPVLRNPLLDLAYQYFYKERLEYFSMFGFVEHYKQHAAHLGNDCREFSIKCIVNFDLTYCIQNWQILHRNRWANDSERLLSRICLIVLCDRLIDSHRESEAEPIAAMLAEAAESFSETWAAGRILARLNEEKQAREVLARSIKFEGVLPVLLLKAGKLLKAWGYVDLAQKAFEHVLNEGSCPLEKIEAGMRLRIGVSQIDSLSSTLPHYVFSIGYYLVRIADVFHKNGCRDRAYDMLLPIVMKQVEVGHYDLFAAAELLDAIGCSEQAEPLIREAIKLGYNDNSFYRKIGLFFEQRGDYSSAVTYLKRSLDIDASWASTHYDLARVYQKLGQSDLEVEHLREALSCSYNKEVDYDALNKRFSFLAQNGVKAHETL